MHGFGEEECFLKKNSKIHKKLGKAGFPKIYTNLHIHVLDYLCTKFERCIMCGFGEEDCFIKGFKIIQR